MTHIELLRTLAQMYGPGCRYLEVGLGDTGCFQQVAPHCRDAIGVDVPENPYGDMTERMRQAGAVYWGDGSDSFFDSYRGEPFDLIFLDGSHWAEQVRRDWENSLRVLAPNGMIALHDTWAPTEDLAMQGSDTAWQVAAEIETDPAFEAFTLPIRPGITLARPRTPRFQ